MTYGKYQPGCTKLYDRGMNSEDMHPISEIVDSWVDSKGEVIGYLVEYVGYEGQSWFVRIDHLYAPLLLRESRESKVTPRNRVERVSMWVMDSAHLMSEASSFHFAKGTRAMLARSSPSMFTWRGGCGKVLRSLRSRWSIIKIERW